MTTLPKPPHAHKSRQKFADTLTFEVTNIGEVCKRLLMIEDSQLSEAVKEQKVYRERGEERKLGELLIQLGYITKEQFDEALALQAKLRSSRSSDPLEAVDTMLEKGFSTVSARMRNVVDNASQTADVEEKEK